MSYYRTCPRCGAHLDPGEVCDCLDIEAQLLIDHVKNAHAGVCITGMGGVEHIEQDISTSSIPED